MRFIFYRATDRTGRNVEGTLQAASVDAAREVLRQNGMAILEIRDLANPVTAAPQRPSPRPPTTQAAIQTPTRTTTQVAADIVHTATGTDKDRFFLFSQLAAALRAGINPAQAFSDVSNRSRPIFEDSLREASTATSQGRPISESFARYPDLYPEHVVGMTRAGETAGFLPEAFEEISRQAESAHAFNRWFFWVWFVVVNFILSIPGMWVATRGLLRSYDSFEANGGSDAQGAPIGIGDATSLVMKDFIKELIWPWGPITLIGYFLIWIFRRYFGSRIAKPLRHRLGLRYPVFGKRARHENLARFAWTMSRVGKAGISPARSWELAAESVPNLEMRDQLAAVGRRLSGSEKMSDVVFKSKLFPEEYAPMVATAEFTGDLPGALQRLADMSYTEFQSAQNTVKARSGCWGLLGCFVTSGIMLAILCWAWYHELPAKILKGTD